MEQEPKYKETTKYHNRDATFWKSKSMCSLDIILPRDKKSGALLFNVFPLENRKVDNSKKAVIALNITELGGILGMIKGDQDQVRFIHKKGGDSRSPYGKTLSMSKGKDNKTGSAIYFITLLDENESGKNEVKTILSWAEMRVVEVLLQDALIQITNWRE